jgi:hypothetical protein
MHTHAALIKGGIKACLRFGIITSYKSIGIFTKIAKMMTMGWP